MPTNFPEVPEWGFNKFGSIALNGWDRRYFETFQEAKNYLLFMSTLLRAYLNDEQHDETLSNFKKKIEMLTEDLVYEIDCHWKLKGDDLRRWRSLVANEAREENYELVRHLDHFTSPINFEWRKFWLKESALAGYHYPFRGARPYWRFNNSFPPKGAE